MTVFEHTHDAARRRRDWLIGTLAGVVTLAATGVGRTLGHVSNSSPQQKLIAWGCALVLLVSGSVAIRRCAHALGHLISQQATAGTGASIRLLATGFGYLLLIFALLGVLGVSLQRLLVGAGLTGVVLGIAAQQSLSNIFASVVLLFARPFVVGDSIRIRSGVVGVMDAVVLGIGLTYVTVRTEDGILKIPNSIMLASGIGRATSPPRVP
ncbi:MAG TPA: mechanosensitive ion channel family protein [Acidimicrobiales bacterium]|nr:mechanosensitive ion channel family protein [Acidimicrobiales bacterium]